jgi:hypothetical protein
MGWIYKADLLRKESGTVLPLEILFTSPPGDIRAIEEEWGALVRRPYSEDLRKGTFFYWAFPFLRRFFFPKKTRLRRENYRVYEATLEALKR